MAGHGAFFSRCVHKATVKSGSAYWDPAALSCRGSGMPGLHWGRAVDTAELGPRGMFLPGKKGRRPGRRKNSRPRPAGAVQAAKLSEDARQKPAAPCPLSHLRAAGSAQSRKTAAAEVVILSSGRQVAFGLFCRCGSPLFAPAKATGAQVFLRSKGGARAAATAFLFFV